MTTQWPETEAGKLLAGIERQYGVPEPPGFAEPFEMILWEMVAYLADDARRRAAEERAERLQTAARLVRDEFAGDLSSVLKLAPQKAKKALMRFPMIGEPGAEKILLFWAACPFWRWNRMEFEFWRGSVSERNARVTRRLISQFGRQRWNNFQGIAGCLPLLICS